MECGGNPLPHGHCLCLDRGLAAASSYPSNINPHLSLIPCCTPLQEKAQMEAAMAQGAVTGEAPPVRPCLL